MIRKIVKLVATGITWGCTISCIISMIGTECLGMEWFSGAAHGYTAQIIASMLIGVAWSVPTLVYENEKLSRAQQVLIHFAVGLCVYFPIAYYMQWIPTESMAMGVISVLVMAIGVLLIWCGFYLYYKNESKVMNQHLQNRK